MKDCSAHVYRQAPSWEKQPRPVEHRATSNVTQVQRSSGLTVFHRWRRPIYTTGQFCICTDIGSDVKGTQPYLIDLNNDHWSPNFSLITTENCNNNNNNNNKTLGLILWQFSVVMRSNMREKFGNHCLGTLNHVKPFTLSVLEQPQ